MDKAVYIFGSSLMHAKKGEEMAGHKYKSREWKNGGWVYDYGDGRKGSSVNEQRHEQKKEEKEELINKEQYVYSRVKTAIDEHDIAMKNKNKYKDDPMANLVYQNLQDIYNATSELEEIYEDKYLRPCQKAKAEMDKYSGSSNPQDRMKYQKAASEYAKKYQVLKAALNEFYDFMKERDAAINRIEESWQKDDESTTWDYKRVMNNLKYLK